MTIIDVELSKLKEYENNPRNNDSAIDYVAKSIKDFGFKVPIVVDSNYVIIAGHTRKKAAEKLGIGKVPCIVADDLTDEQIKAFRIIENKTSEFAEWDDNLLSNEIIGLKEFEFDFDLFGIGEKDILLEETRKAWKHEQKKCDLKQKLSLWKDGEMIYTSFYKTGTDGICLEDIKSTDKYVEMFADDVVNYVKKSFGNISRNQWCICTTPRRRHKEGFHFATEICRIASDKLAIPFYADIVQAKNRHRIDPEFELTSNPKESNVLLYDDILTTGSTMKATRKLLIDNNHSVFSFVSIRNKGKQ